MCALFTGYAFLILVMPNVFWFTCMLSQLPFWNNCFYNQDHIKVDNTGVANPLIFDNSGTKSQKSLIFYTLLLTSQKTGEVSGAP